MNLFIIASGIVSGALYATTGLGVSIVYRSSRLLNFALAGTSTLAVYVATQVLYTNAPAALVVVVACAVGALTGGLSEILLAPLRRQPHMTVGIASLGVLLIAQGVVEWNWGYQPKRVSWFAGNSFHLKVPGGRLSELQIVAFIIAIVAVAIVYWIVERTRYGLSLRMASSGPMTAQLLGVNIWRARQSTWAIGGVLGAIAALLVTALTYLDPTTFTSFLIVAFVATVLGGFTNLVGVALGGFVMGVLVDVMRVEFSSQLSQTYTFIIVAVVLALRPNGLLGKPEATVPEPEMPPKHRPIVAVLVSRFSHIRVDATPLSANDPQVTPARRRTTVAIGTVVVLAVLLVLPNITSVTIQALLPSAMTTYIAVLGLNVLAGYTGQLSVGHSAFMALGGYTAAICAERWHVPALATLPLGLLAGIVFGVIVGLPAARLAGLFLTILTIMLPFVVTEVALLYGGLTGGTSGMTLSYPDWLFDSRNQYYFGLAIAAVCTAAVVALRYSPLGQRWIAVRDAQAGAQSVGISPTAAKLTAFTIGCGLAGLSGAMDTGFVGSVNPSSYTAWLAIYLLAAVIIGGTGSILGSLIGAFFITLIPNLTGGASIPPDFLFGAVLLVVMLISPSGIVGLAQKIVTLAKLVIKSRRGAEGWDPSVELAGLSTSGEEPGPATVLETPTTGNAVAGHGAEQSEGILQVHDLTAGYGPIRVLRGLDLIVRQGEVTALIGANGAGKSTLLRVISGLVNVDAGEVCFRGQPILSHDPYSIARLGIAHVPEGRGIFPDLTVKENLVSARFCAPNHKTDIDAGLAVFPQLTRFLGRTAGTLSGGEQQMVAIARAIAARPALVMLDEPSLGLSPKASKDLFAALRQLKQSDITVLIIEQNARAALGLADTCCLVAHGAIVRTGPADAFEDDDMVATYLGVTR